MSSPSNYHARLQFEKTNSYARVYVSKDESTLPSLEKHELQQAMQHRISSSILPVNTRPVCPPLELCGLHETEKSSVTEALEMKSWASRHPFSDLEPADLLILTPYYLPYYLGGIDPWRESLRVFPPGYPDEDLKNTIKKTIQTYEIQLNLLEQQNKKRLVMARQEQGEVFRASNA
ncbi:hypothetical protein VE01_09953 [Pseudogymnoascus verrucosus]|uniref:Uncharacterized protein n=1 Tax=Pseudogymnoascus verrucosus TaxID=342668 RepID=A0A1B8G841_9PEZI|nr:uncharacterized protein VE01_09953 [Pseudogymnoascus verrucosus]OBT91998.1 hypothetical protein VE01_09953 [Pseudogymnoascus verrucosus]